MLPHIAVISVNDKAGNVIEPCELNRDSSKSCARPPWVAAAFQPQNASGENLSPSWCLSDVCVKDPNATGRVLQGILTGIGFLGAGVILRDVDGHVSGLTNAATVWMGAVLGMACGLACWSVVVIAGVMTALALILPWAVARLSEYWFKLRK